MYKKVFNLLEGALKARKLYTRTFIVTKEVLNMKFNLKLNPNFLKFNINLFFNKKIINLSKSNLQIDK
nr:hypothetical protein [Borreliella finlandensis]